MFSYTIEAATIEWDGGAGTNNWSDADNWDSNTVPGSGDYAYIRIAANVEYSGTSTIERFRLNHASATFTIQVGASLTVDGTNSDGFRADLGVVTNNGTLTIQNIGNGSNDNCIDLRSTFHNNGTIITNGSTDDGVVAYDAAIFNNNAGATLTINNAGDFGFYISGGSTSTLNNDGTITINNAPDDAIRLEIGILNNNSTGIIDINTPADLGISVLNSGVLNNLGLIDVSGSIARYGLELFHNGSASATVNNMIGGIINILSTAQEGLYVGVNTTLNNDGTIKVNNSGTNIDINREAGSTYINTSNAQYTPGASPGVLNVTGDFEFGGSKYICEINGTTAITQYDVMAITGAATITGASLEVDWGIYTPNAGESYTILTAASIIGSFSSILIPSVSGLTFSAMNSGTGIIISAQTLPVELINFNAKVSDKTKVLLLWQTASEINNSGFEIQRSTDGRSWEILAFVEGASNSSIIESYRYEDTKASVGDNYYRLKQIDFDGNFEFSNVALATLSSANHDFKIAPNPSVDGRISIGIDIQDFQLHNLQIISIDGELQKNLTIERNIEQLDLSELADGMYYLRISGAQLNNTRLFQIIR